MHQLIEHLEQRRLRSATVVDSTGDVGKYASLALQPITREPAIDYYDATNANLKFTYRVRGQLLGASKLASILGRGSLVP